MCFCGGRAFKPSAVLLMRSTGPWVHPAPDTLRSSLNRQSVGQLNGFSALADSRHRCITSPLGVLRCR